MCDFKPGDEVVCVDAQGSDGLLSPRARYTVSVAMAAGQKTTRRNGGSVILSQAVVQLAGLGHVEDCLTWGWNARRFRKVQTRDLAAWLQTADHREPAPRCPKVLAVLRMVSQ